MRLHQSVQAEVLLSLALVMVTATGLLTAVFLETNHARIESLHALIGQGFVTDSRSPRFELHPTEGGLWWQVDAGGHLRGLNASLEELDAGTRVLAEDVVDDGDPRVASGAPWQPIRFAAPSADGRGVVMGRIDAPLSGSVLALLLLIDVVIFGLCGFSLLRRRVVGPLQRLAVAVREIGDGDGSTRVPVEGAAEIAELGAAFNEMQEALAARTGALETAVGELREANAHLEQAREGLDRAERLSMVGSLAAGVAHEVGNPMGALLAFLDGASRDPGLGDDGRRCLSRASEQGERIRLILRQLLDFSRPPQVQHGPFSLGDTAHQAVELVAAQVRYSEIQFDVDVPEDLPIACGDQSLASQVLLNLVVNAAAAVEQKPDARVRLELCGTAWRRRAEDPITAGSGSARSDAVVCVVHDSGAGVTEDQRERIFDPFFTTKEPGQGTGLGLANARRLAEEMQGRVELEEENSSLGGARFSFTLRTQEAESGAGGTIRARNQSDASRIP